MKLTTMALLGSFFAAAINPIATQLSFVSPKALAHPNMPDLSLQILPITCKGARTLFWDSKQILAVCPGDFKIMAIYEEVVDSNTFVTKDILVASFGQGEAGSAPVQPIAWNHGLAVSNNYL